MSNPPAVLNPPAIDPKVVTVRRGSKYPAPFADIAIGRSKQALGEAAGLRNFGVNLVHLPPGSWSSQRHWHTKEDEFVYVLEGELVLITNGGEQVLGAGMAAGFPAGQSDGHHLVNRSDRVAVYLEVGDRDDKDEVFYSDIDMELRRIGGKSVFVHRNGEPY